MRARWGPEAVLNCLFGGTKPGALVRPPKGAAHWTTHRSRAADEDSLAVRSCLYIARQHGRPALVDRHELFTGAVWTPATADPWPPAQLCSTSPRVERSRGSCISRGTQPQDLYYSGLPYAGCIWRMDTTSPYAPSSVVRFERCGLTSWTNYSIRLATAAV